MEFCFLERLVLGTGERDSRGGFDGIGVEGSFVDREWALSLLYFGCTKMVFTDTTGL
jgi:hypothetical protein